MPQSSTFYQTSTGSRAFPRTRCGECEPCKRKDCGTCNECVRKKKFGGSGTSRQACVHRKCIHLTRQDRPTPSSSSRNTTTPNNTSSNRSRHGTPSEKMMTSTAAAIVSSVSTVGSSNLPASAIKLTSSSAAVVIAAKKIQAKEPSNPWGITYKRPASLLGDQSLKRVRMDAKLQDDYNQLLLSSPPSSEAAALSEQLQRHVAGHEIPDKIVGVCGYCHTDGGNDAILLCDGEGYVCCIWDLNRKLDACKKEICVRCSLWFVCFVFRPKSLALLKTTTTTTTHKQLWKRVSFEMLYSTHLRSTGR